MCVVFAATVEALAVEDEDEDEDVDDVLDVVDIDDEVVDRDRVWERVWDTETVFAATDILSKLEAFSNSFRTES